MKAVRKNTMNAAGGGNPANTNAELEDILLDDLAKMIVYNRAKVIEMMQEIGLLDGYKESDIAELSNTEICEMISYAMPKSKKLKEKTIRLISNGYYKAEGDNTMWRDTKVRGRLLNTIHRAFTPRGRGADGEPVIPNADELIERVKEVSEQKAEKEAAEKEIKRKRNLKIFKYVGITGGVMVLIFVGFKLYKKYLAIPSAAPTMSEGGETPPAAPVQQTTAPAEAPAEASVSATEV